jgi:hypothetical protein
MKIIQHTVSEIHDGRAKLLESRWDQVVSAVSVEELGIIY